MKNSIRLFIRSYFVPLYILLIGVYLTTLSTGYISQKRESLLAMFFFAHIFVMAGLEWFDPRAYAKETKRRKLYSLFSSAVNTLVVGTVVKAALVAGVIYSMHFLLKGNMDPFGIQQIPLVLQVAIAFALNELLRYWIHRWQHTVPALWHFHKFHHEVETLNVTNLYRSHPIDYFLRNIVPPVLIYSFGFSIEATFYSTMITMIAMFSHCGADLRLGFWNKIFVTAEVHRWHHVKEFKGVGYNFAVCFALWDHVFGTYKLEVEDPETPLTLGISDAG